MHSCLLLRLSICNLELAKFRRQKIGNLGAETETGERREDICGMQNKPIRLLAYSSLAVVNENCSKASFYPIICSLFWSFINHHPAILDSIVIYKKLEICIWRQNIENKSLSFCQWWCEIDDSMEIHSWMSLAELSELQHFSCSKRKDDLLGKLCFMSRWKFTRWAQLASA